MNDWHPDQDDAQWTGAAASEKVAGMYVRRTGVFWQIVFIFAAAVCGFFAVLTVLGIDVGPFGIGLGCLWFVFGVAFFLVSLAFIRHFYLCGGCGNRVENTSRVCPVCQSRLVHPDRLAVMQAGAIRVGVRNPTKKRPVNRGPKRGGR